MEASSLKKVSNAWRHGSQLVRVQVNIEVEAKAYSPIHSTSEALVVQCVVGGCHGEELSPFGWPMLAAGIAIFSASHRFAEHTSQMSWFCQESERCSELDWQQTTKQWPWPFLSACEALGCALELLGPGTELVVTSYLKSTCPHMSQSTRKMVCCCCGE